MGYRCAITRREQPKGPEIAGPVVRDSWRGDIRSRLHRSLGLIHRDIKPDNLPTQHA